MNMRLLIGFGISLALILISLLLKIARLLHLTIPLAYIAVVIIFFNDWYIQNMTLAHIILVVMLIGVIVSWVVIGINKLRNKQLERNRAELDAIINSERLYYRKIERNN
ncbi:MAG: lipopolysaccharide assembly protein LapA domain-containing protein [Eubacteriales bacterium]